MYVSPTSRRKVQWCREYVAALEALKPGLSARPDWDSALYLMSEGLSPVAAAERIASRCT